MNTYLVLLMNRNGHPWSDRRALRLQHAHTTEEAVAAAHPFPPSYDVDHALVVRIEGALIRVPVEVPRPEWSEPEHAGGAPA